MGDIVPQFLALLGGGAYRSKVPGLTWVVEREGQNVRIDFLALPEFGHLLPFVQN